MLHAAVRYAIPMLALFGAGPLAGYLTASLRTPDAGKGASLLVSVSPMQGVVAGLVSMGLALGVGVLGARFVGRRAGMFSAGLVLAWAALNTGRVDTIIGRMASAGPLNTIALEGVLVGVLGVLVALVIFAIPERPVAAPPAPGQHHLPPEPTKVLDSTAPIAIAVAMAAAGVACYLIAQSTLKGQTFAAAIIGGVFAAAAGRVASQRVSPVIFVAAIAVLAAASPALATFVHTGADGTLKAAIAGRLFVLARPLPLDWLAGAFLGVPVGLTWAGSMIEKHVMPK